MLLFWRWTAVPTWNIPLGFPVHERLQSDFCCKWKIFACFLIMLIWNCAQGNMDEFESKPACIHLLSHSQGKDATSSMWKEILYIGSSIFESQKNPFLLIPFSTPLLMVQWKLHCQSWKQKQKNQPIKRPRIEHCNWFNVLLLLASPTMQFSVDCKQWNCKQKWCYASASIGLIFTRSSCSTLLNTTPTMTRSLVETSL